METEKISGLRLRKGVIVLESLRSETTGDLGEISFWLPPEGGLERVSGSCTPKAKPKKKPHWLREIVRLGEPKRSRWAWVWNGFLEFSSPWSLSGETYNLRDAQKSTDAAQSEAEKCVLFLGKGQWNVVDFSSHYEGGPPRRVPEGKSESLEWSG